MREKAKIIMKDRKRGITMRWYGGHGVHAYKAGKEIAFWNTGDFSKNNADEKDILDSMKEVKKEGNYEDYM